ncbi:MAG: site-2 protease family protein [Thermoflexales bacterium]|nr:site-2 protease family protein [Thermoflexales bacterium]
MEASVKLGRIWGIPIGLHASWFLIFGLVTWSLAAGYFPGEYPALPSGAYWLLGALTSLLFFGSVLAHELGHSWVALRHQIPVRSVTLFIFGGVAHIGREPRTPGAEFRIAVAGPLTSAGLALAFGGLFLLDRHIPYLAAPSMWLARINLMLALFNLIPGFPLDGGRVLRALVWKISGSFYRATQVAAFSGQVVAFGFIGLGALTVIGGNWFNGVWLVFIGWFLQNAAAATYAQANMQQSLRGITVGQVMQRDCWQIPGPLTLDQLVEEHVLTGGRRCFLVTDADQLQGLLTLRDVSAVPKADWGQITAMQAMRPLDQLVRVEPATELQAALRLMDEANVAQVPVVEGQRIAGMLSREQVLHYLRVRAELGV